MSFGNAEQPSDESLPADTPTAQKPTDVGSAAAVARGALWELGMAGLLDPKQLEALRRHDRDPSEGE